MRLNAHQKCVCVSSSLVRSSSKEVWVRKGGSLLRLWNPPPTVGAGVICLDCRMIHVFLVPAGMCLSMSIIVNMDVYVGGRVVWKAVVLVLAGEVADGQYQQDDSDGESLQRQHQQGAQHGRHDAQLVCEGQQQHQTLARATERTRFCEHASQFFKQSTTVSLHDYVC